MFDKDFYPTNEEIATKMLRKLPCFFRGRILEPSAGKGDLIESIKKHMGNVVVDCLEKNVELNNILRAKGFYVVGSDFLAFDTFTTYDAIIANPPFSNGVKHVLKMIEVAENNLSDCYVVTLLNAETIKNPFSNDRKELLRKLELYNANIEYLESPFLNSERKTEVEVALIDFNVPNQAKETTKRIFEQFKEQNQSTDLSTFVKANELDFKVDEIQTLIKTYQSHAKKVKELYGLRNELETFESFSDVKPFFKIGDDEYNVVIDRLRVGYWKLVLNSEKFRKILTEKSYEELMSKIESLNYIDLTEENAMIMLSSLYTNRSELLYDSLVEFFDNVTSLHQEYYSKNIHLYNGWKSNSAYKINPKIVIFQKCSYWRLGIDENTFTELPWDTRNQINDIVKVFQLVSGTQPTAFEKTNERIWENNLIRFKLFKKGTIHIWFKDLDSLDRLNLLVGQRKNWLPTDEEIKQNKQAKDFVEKLFPKNKLLK